MKIIDKLENLAEQTRIRLGTHPDYHTLKEAIRVLKVYEERETETMAVVDEPEKPKRSRTRKSSE